MEKTLNIVSLNGKWAKMLNEEELLVAEKPLVLTKTEEIIENDFEETVEEIKEEEAEMILEEISVEKVSLRKSKESKLKETEEIEENTLQTEIIFCWSTQRATGPDKYKSCNWL